MFDDKRMELEPEDHRKLIKEFNYEKIILWTLISVVLSCILLLTYKYLLSIIYSLLFMIYLSFFNPFAFMFTVFIFIFIGLVGDFMIKNFSVIKNFKLGEMQNIDKNDEKILINATEKKILKYLEVNIGNAYSKDALLKRVVEKVKHPYFKKYIKKNWEKVLENLVLEGKILTAQKDGKIHYFTSLIIN